MRIRDDAVGLEEFSSMCINNIESDDDDQMVRRSMDGGYWEVTSKVEDVLPHTPSFGHQCQGNPPRGGRRKAGA